MELPPNPYSLYPDLYNAYNSCLQLERRQLWGVHEEEVAAFRVPPLLNLSPKVVGRCLGQTLLNAPSDNGRNSFANDINSCDSLGKLASLAHLVVQGMIRIFYNPKGRVPVELQKHSPRPSFTPQAERIAKAMKEPLEESNVKTLVQLRDNYRCIISGTVDIVADEGSLTKWNKGEPLGHTQLGHIFSQSTIKDIGDPEDGPIEGSEKTKREWASAAATIIERYAGISIVQELNGSKIHRAENSFVSSNNVHQLFDSLHVAITPKGANQPNTYQVHTFPPDRHEGFGVPTEITLTDHSNGLVPMPNPRYFELHCICAKVMHLSGAAEVIDKLLRDLEEIDVLAVDGSNATQLSFALSMALNREVAPV
ncbi:hypothetical protein BDP27DRAFT_1328211 [Rhodocollybia butyracea]|uniref:HNH nuclease domain-containing protein n=1 Tax=Rhodocollybia butyracea TaxID=206335 RepID=A0A9P5PR46_9AGAR|nr:hypothetical protein BDP27DRAFT_1328211 [Rhodocollybia butyracea]